MAFLNIPCPVHHIKFSSKHKSKAKQKELRSRWTCSMQPERSNIPKANEQTTSNDSPPNFGSESRSFCQKCGSKMEQRKPDGDVRTRHVCIECKTVAYENPKVVVGCVPVSKDKKRVLLARRAIPPIGKWTVPAGFLELGEVAEVGAAREAWEETRAKLDMAPVTLLAVYNILPAQQVQLLYRCTLLNEDTIAPGEETQEVKMFEWNEIPWDELAFPTIRWALEYSKKIVDCPTIYPDLKNR